MQNVDRISKGEEKKYQPLPALMESPIFHSDKLAEPIHREEERRKEERERETIMIMCKI